MDREKKVQLPRKGGGARRKHRNQDERRWLPPNNGIQSQIGIKMELVQVKFSLIMTSTAKENTVRLECKATDSSHNIDHPLEWKTCKRKFTEGGNVKKLIHAEHTFNLQDNKTYTYRFVIFLNGTEVSTEWSEVTASPLVFVQRKVWAPDETTIHIRQCQLVHLDSILEGIRDNDSLRRSMHEIHNLKIPSIYKSKDGKEELVYWITQLELKALCSSQVIFVMSICGLLLRKISSQHEGNLPDPGKDDATRLLQTFGDEGNLPDLGKDDATRLLQTFGDEEITRRDLPGDVLKNLELISIWLVTKIDGCWVHALLYFSSILEFDTIFPLKYTLCKKISLGVLNELSQQYFQKIKQYSEDQQRDLLFCLVDSCQNAEVLLHFVQYFLATDSVFAFAPEVIDRVVISIKKSLPRGGSNRTEALYTLWKDESINLSNKVATFVRMSLIDTIKTEPWPFSVDEGAKLLITQGGSESDRNIILDSVLKLWHTSESRHILLRVMTRKDVTEVFHNDVIESLLEDGLKQLTRPIDNKFSERGRRNNMKQNYELLALIRELDSPRILQYYDTVVFMGISEAPLEELAANVCDDTSYINLKENECITDHILRRLKDEKITMDTKKEMILRMKHKDGGFGCLMLKDQNIVRIVESILDTITEVTVVDVVEQSGFWKLIFGCHGEKEKISLILEHKTVRRITKLLCDYMESLRNQNIRLGDKIWQVLENERRKRELNALMMVVQHIQGKHWNFLTLVQEQVNLKTSYEEEKEEIADFHLHCEALLSTFLIEEDREAIQRVLLESDDGLSMNRESIDAYWGEKMRKILLTVRYLKQILPSRIYLNVCFSILRQDGSLRSATSTGVKFESLEKVSIIKLCHLMILSCKDIFGFYCKEITSECLNIHTNVLAILLEGIETTDILQGEVELIEESYGTVTPKETFDVLCHFIHREELKQKAHLCLSILQQIEGMATLADVEQLRVSCSDDNNLTLDDWLKGIAPLLELEDCLQSGVGENRSEVFWEIIQQLLNSQSLLKFLREIIDEDLRNLIDTVGKHSEEWLDFMDVKRYVTPFIKNKNLRQSDVYESLLTFPRGIRMSDIPTLISKCSKNTQLLHKLYRSMATRSKITLDDIKNALIDGQFSFLWDDVGEECHVSLRYSRREPDGEAHDTYNMEELCLLRSRALLYITSKPPDRVSESCVSSTGEPNLPIFVDCINIAKSIASLYTDVMAAGFIPLGSEKFIPVSIFELIEFETTLTNELSACNNVLDEARKEHFYLNFFSAKQLRLLEQFFCGNVDMCENIKLLFHYLYPYFDLQQERRADFKRYDTNADLRTRLQSIAKELDSTLSGKSRNIRNISLRHPSGKTLDSTVQAGEVFIALLPKESRKSTVSVVMQLCVNTTGSYPEPNEILFCQRETSFQEIDLLLRRCSPCSEVPRTYLKRRLHLIVNAEKLSTEAQIALVDKIKWIQREQNNDFLLAIICRGDKTHHVIRQFPLRLTHRIYGMSNEGLSSCLNADFSHVEVVTSKYAGLGKTQFIKNKTSKYVSSILISGPVNKRCLVESLKSKSAEGTTLHLDLREMNDPEILDTLIFELIVIGMISTTERACRCSWKSVFIEIANSLEDRLQESLDICMMFKHTLLEWKDFEDYIISSDIKSAEQVVCQYKKALDERRIDNEDISLDDGIPLPAKICQSLLREMFAGQKSLSFAHVKNVLHISSGELRKVSQSLFFYTSTIQHVMARNPFRKVTPSVRSDVVQGLLDVAMAITTRPALVPSAAIRYNRFGSPSADAMVRRFKEMIKWSESNRLLMVFNRQDSETVTVLYRNQSVIPVPIKRYLESQREQLHDYAKMSQTDLREILERVCRKSSKLYDQDNLRGLQERYVLTTDNMLKMVLIMVRIEARVPVILMGETGCGKTMLITYLARLSEVTLKVLRLHAGTTASAINDLLEEILEEAQNEEPEKNSEIWVFFDEINTCDHLGLLTEIICHKRYKGMALPSNVVCLAACNPYIKLKGERTREIGLKRISDRSEMSKLVYCVHPLPETMSDYVWDFGSLEERDEDIYIERMVKGVISIALEELFIVLLTTSQRFIRQKERANYSVSLRDVDRCKYLMRWITDHLLKKKGLAKNPFFREVPQRCNNPEFRGMILALAHCYHSRLIKEEDRKEYRDVVARRCQQYGFIIREVYIKEVIRAEQNDLIRRMNCPAGTANNEALRENIFVILIAIMTKIPVFVVGKPGCSKSLAMNLIENNLRGTESDDKFFQTLPGVFKLSFQGSESSTSNEVIRVFTTAKQYIKDGHQPFVLLDEVGLAERSRHNPLKVLHSLLDPDDSGFPPVTMVGLSNWTLDAAKMNRAIHLSRPDPTIKDLEETAKAIRDGLGEIHNESVTDAKLHQISKAYYDYKKVEQRKNFHGLRDFYSMIKYLTMQPCNRGVAARALLRNFGGLPKHETSHIVNVIAEIAGIMLQSDKLPTTVELIEENLNDKNARHLMLITKGNSCLTILQQILKKRKHLLLCGSSFRNDFTEEYDHRMLSKIILHMETDCTLVLMGLESIYGCLYDMLNQNYTEVAGKKFCRVALGANCNLLREVHPDFKCIMLIDEHDLRYCDPPFLNRVEKQAVGFSDILTEFQQEVVGCLRRQIDDISRIPDPKFTPEESFLGYHEGTLPSIVLRNTEPSTESALRDVSDVTVDDEMKKRLLKRCMGDMLNLASSDAVLRFSKSQASAQEKLEISVTSLQHEYFAQPLQEGIRRFMASLFGDQITLSCTDSKLQAKRDADGLKLVIYTYSSIHEDINNCLEGVTTYRGPLSLQVEKLSSFSSERHLDTQCRQFWLYSDAQMLVIQSQATLDAPHGVMANCLIDQYRSEYLASRKRKANGSKHVCFVIHVDRGTCEHNQQQLGKFDFLNDWLPFTLETLDAHPYAKTDVTSVTIMEVITSSSDIDNIAKEQLLWCFNCIKYTSRDRDVECIFKLIRAIAESDNLMEAIREHVLRVIRNDAATSDTKMALWEMEVACNRQLLIECSTMAEARKEYVKKNIRKPLAKMIYAVEKLCAWNSIMKAVQNETISRQGCFQFWLDCFRNPKIFSCNYTDLPDPMGVHSYIVDKPLLDLRFPFFVVFHEKIQDKCNLLMGTLKQCEDTCLPADVESICNRLAEVMDLEIPQQMQEDYLPLLLSEYMDDFCNVLSDIYVPDTNTRLRIDTTKWLLQLYGAPKEVTRSHSDPRHSLARLYVAFWTNKRAITVQIQLVIAFLECSRYRLENLQSEVTSNIQRNALSASGEVSYHLVSAICRSILPTHKNIRVFGGLSLWCHHATKVIAIASKVDYDPMMLHLLMVCADFFQLLTKAKCTEYKSIAMIAEVGNTEEEALERPEIFREIQTTLHYLRLHRALPEDELDNFLCLFIGRCIEANIKTPLLPEFVNSLINERDLVTGARPVLFTILGFELDAVESCDHLLSLWANLLTGDLSETPGLSSVDQHLHSQEHIGSPLAVACCDVLEEILQEHISRSNLADLDMEDVIALIVDTIESAGKCTLQIVAAIAFTRTLFKSFAGKFEEGESPDLTKEPNIMLAEHINTLLRVASTNQSQVRPLQLYMLKCMRKFRTRTELAEECRVLSTDIPALDSVSWSVDQYQNRLGFRPMLYVTHYETTEEALLNWHEDKDLSGMARLFRNARDDPEYRLALLAVIMHHGYLTRSLGNNNKVLGERFKAYVRDNTRGFPPGSYEFLCRLLRVTIPQTKETDEKVLKPDWLQLSEASTSRQVAQASVVVHVSAILLSSSDDTQPNAFMQYVEHLGSLQELYFPASGKAVPFGTQMDDYQPQTMTYYCSCGQVIILPDAKERCDDCPTCGSFCKREHWKSDQELVTEKTDTDLPGYGIQYEHNKKAIFTGIRSLSPIPYRVIRILFHSCLLIGCSIKQPIKANMMQVLDATTTCKVREDLTDRLLADWDILEELLNLNYEEVSIFLHLIVQETRAIFSSTTYSAQSVDGRDRLEKDLAEVIEHQVQLIPECLRQFQMLCTKTNSPIECCIEEIALNITDESLGEVAAISLGDLHNLLRYTKQASFEDFRASFLLQGRVFYDKHPFLTLFFRWYESLQYIKYLLTLIEWNATISSILCHRLNRSTASSKTHDEILNDANFVPDTYKRQELNDLFDKFKEAWDQVRGGWKIITGSDDDLEPMSERQPVIASLFCREKPQNQLWRMIEALQYAQNRFLREVATVAVTHSSSCLQCLHHKGMIALPYVLLNEVQEQDLINFDINDVCLFFHDLVTTSQKGTYNRYDFVQIENKLVKDIVRHKAILQNQSEAASGNFVFADELFHACSAILKDVQTQVPQKKLPRDVANLLRQEYKQNKPFTRELLEQLETLLGLLKRTGGKPNVLLSDYCKMWYSGRPQKLMTDLIPKPTEEIKLKHVIDLYQTVEGLLSEDIVQSLQKKYSDKIPNHLETKLHTKCSNASVSDLKMVKVTIERFVFRYLRTKNNIRPQECLVEMLTSLQYMPTLGAEDSNIVIAVIDKEVTISNIRPILMSLENEIQKNEHSKSRAFKGASRRRKSRFR